MIPRPRQRSLGKLSNQFMTTTSTRVINRIVCIVVEPCIIRNT